MRNLEAKFRLTDHAAARARAEAIGFATGATFEQRDTFFATRAGKLKLREEAGRASLIYYSRISESGLELSDYAIAVVADAAAVRTMLADALGVVAEVRKHRTVLTRRNVRLHLDRVDGLGDFGEIEAVLGDGDNAAHFRGEVGEIIAALGVDIGHLIRKSYFEIILSKPS